MPERRGRAIFVRLRGEPSWWKHGTVGERFRTVRLRKVDQLARTKLVESRSPVSDESAVDRGAVQHQLERVLSSAVFKKAERSSAMLRFIVEQTLNGNADRLKEYTLGAEGLGRGESFDPRTDPVVRAEASRLRGRLEQYYKASGGTDPIVIGLSKGSYVPQFIPNTPTPDSVGEKPIPESRVLLFARSPNLAWACAIGGVVIAALAWLATWPNQQRLLPAQFEVELKSEGLLASDVGTTVVLSPEGSRMAFVSRDADGRTHLNVRSLDRADTIRLAGTEGARGPFLSPDGRWLGYWADGKLKKIATDGGSPVVLCEASDLLGASWGDDDTIIAALGAPGQLSRIPASGGKPTVAIDLSAESTVVRWPQLLPGDEAVIYTAMSGAGADRANIEVQSAVGGNRKVLVQGGTFGRYLRDGYLTYINQGTLYAVRMNLSTLSVDGAPIPLLNDVAYSPLFGYAQADVSRTGMLVYRKGADGNQSVINWIDRTGRTTSFLSIPGRYGWMRLSPDGLRLALTTQESGIASISVYDVKTTEMSRVTTRPGDYTGLTWMGAGSLAFGGATGLGWVPSTGSADSASLMTVKTAQTPWSMSPDGQRLAYYERSPETGFDLWTVPILRSDKVSGLGRPEPFLRTRAFEVYPSFSLDGRWMSYASNESGTFEIYVRRFPDDGTKVRVSRSGGVVPYWSPNGRELLYRTDANRVMVVSYKTAGESFTASEPRPWSQHTLVNTGVLPNFAVDASGERILALMATPSKDPQSVNHVTVILNFDEEVRRRAASR
jgi:eukaryotic-like serine/threonine-protein kinase